MITEYIPNTINFRIVTLDKYKNCKTREQVIKEREEKSKSIKPDKNGYISLDPAYLDDLESELFAGDEIIGVYIHEDRNEICLYKWKENNPKEIGGYCIINKFKVTETINDIELIRRDK